MCHLSCWYKASLKNNFVVFCYLKQGIFAIQSLDEPFFFKIDPQTTQKTSLIYFGPTKTLRSPSQKPSWGPRLLETPLWSHLWLPGTRQDPLQNTKTKQQGSKSPITPTKTPISPCHLKSYSPGLLSTLQDPWKFRWLFWKISSAEALEGCPLRSLYLKKKNYDILGKLWAKKIHCKLGAYKLVVNFPKKSALYFPEKGAGWGGQGPFGLSPKNHPFWWIQASLGLKKKKIIPKRVWHQ